MGQTSYSAPSSGGGGFWLQNGDTSISPVSAVDGIKVISPDGSNLVCIPGTHTMFDTDGTSNSSLLSIDATGAETSLSFTGALRTNQIVMNPGEVYLETIDNTTGDTNQVYCDGSLPLRALRNGANIFGINSAGHILTNQFTPSVGPVAAVQIGYIVIYDNTGSAIGKIPVT